MSNLMSKEVKIKRLKKLQVPRYKKKIQNTYNQRKQLRQNKEHEKVKIFESVPPHLHSGRSKPLLDSQARLAILTCP